MGIKHPAIDKISASIPETDDHKKRIDQMRAYDRVLIANHYVIPHWYIDYDRVAYWACISPPENLHRMELTSQVVSIIPLRTTNERLLSMLNRSFFAIYVFQKRENTHFIVSLQPPWVIINWIVFMRSFKNKSNQNNCYKKSPGKRAYH